MTGASTLIRTLLIYSICLPLAVFVGFMVTDPLQTSTFVEMGLLLFFLMIPLLLKWHREMLIVSWNLGAMLFFLPGRPEAWLAMAWISLVFAVLQYILNPRERFLHAPSIAKPLIFLAAVVLITALCRGGIGIAALGSETYGGKKYLLIFSAIVGYFALTSHQISPRRATFWVVLFFASAATVIIGDLAGYLAPGFYYIYLIFPLGSYGYDAVVSDFSTPDIGLSRMGGIAFGSASILYAMMARYGIRDIFDTRKLLRIAVFAVLLITSLLGGFRSILIQFAMTFTIIFYLEDLFRSRLMPILVIAMVLVGTLTVGFIDRMPLNVQRTLSFLPIDVDPLAKASAQDSTDWRVRMWKEVIPEVPRYLLLGKGFGFSGTDLRALTTSQIGGRDQLSNQGSALAGDYHNGPLSLLLPLGIWGAIGFVWFIVAALKVLYQNYKFGNPTFQILNRFLLGYFISKTILFFCVFGSLYSDLAAFVGIIGLSVALNAGVARAVVVRGAKQLAPLRIHPARRPVEAV